MLRIAIAKGRTASKVQDMLKDSNEFGNIMDLKSRKLIFSNDDKNIEFILVKPSDLPVYVENGAVDVGIVGKDILMENYYSVHELYDLRISSCKLAVAGLPESQNTVFSTRRIATKYPKIASEYFKKKLERIEIIKLDGSVEMAPLLGLSDAIVDIVESGDTLRENGIVIYEDICDISARVVVNKISYKLKNDAVNRLISTFDKINGGVSIA
jgi:ATP phosphoribosyltransferase